MRYRIRDLDHLRECVRKSQRVIRPHSVRSLAELTGKSRTQIGYLLTGARPTLDEDAARIIASALGRTVGDLFLPDSSQSRDGKEQASE